MSARPATLDSLQFATAGRNLSGEFTAAESDRLGDILDPSHGAVQYTLSGGLQGGRPVLRLHIEATVRLECQRCLEPFSMPLTIEPVLLVARDEVELSRWEAEDGLLDAIQADSRLDVQKLVEDEILLGLPLVPRHPDGGCEATLRA